MVAKAETNPETDDRGQGGFGLGRGEHPKPIDEDAARRWIADLREAAEERGLNRLGAFLESGHPDTARLSALLDLSPFLNGIILKNPEWLEDVLTEGAAACVKRTIESVAGHAISDMNERGLMTALREAKRRIALLLAMSETFGGASLEETTGALSDFAEAAVGAALRFCLADLNASGKIALPFPEEPEKECGLFVLGMGKLGARELNYSSDIDIIVFFDADKPLTPDPMDASETLARLVRKLTRILNERTGDGYVFRTDLRLRPDPSAMPLAMSTDMALTYYEGSGRDWERAAMIKARTIAGDRKAGEAFLKEVTPFVWRKYLDFSAVAAIQDMKQRIDRHRGFESIGLAGHNVKLGRGGIREIEFFAQAQQLIAGGRAPKLRQRRTDRALAELASGGWIAGKTAEELTSDYWFLRRVEHAIQMQADEQSHTLPEDDEKLAAVAHLAGFSGVDALGEALLPCLKRVDRHYSGLFSEGRDEADRGDDHSALATLSRTPDDPTAIAALESLGYERPNDIARVVHSWTLGRYRATQTNAARQRLSEVLPVLLVTFGKAPDPDGALVAFDRFLAGLPAGIQFFSLIASNPKTLELLAVIMTSAPTLRETIAARPHVFDALLDPAFLGELPERELLAERLAAFMAMASDYEDELTRLRIFASEQRFLVGARMLSGIVDADEAGPAFSNIADVVLESTLTIVERAFVEVHGRVPGARIALLGMGRLGSQELTASSDLDLILLYDHDPDAEASDGRKALSPAAYFARLTQRLIAALTAPMREGILYDVDFRLRPSGNKGPLATDLEAFRLYQAKEAWTWERMALTRSRPIAGDPDLMREVADTIAAIVGDLRDPEEVTRDVAEMRDRIARAKPAGGALDLKLRPGGLIDLEFLAQWAILTGRVDPAFCGRPTETVLAAAAFPPPEVDGVRLADAMNRLTRITQLLRLGPSGATEFSEVPLGLLEAITRSLGFDDVDALTGWVDAETRMVRDCFEAVVGAADEEDSAE